MGHCSKHGIVDGVEGKKDGFIVVTCPFCGTVIDRKGHVAEAA